MSPDFEVVSVTAEELKNATGGFSPARRAARCVGSRQGEWGAAAPLPVLAAPARRAAGGRGGRAGGRALRGELGVPRFALAGELSSLGGSVHLCGALRGNFKLRKRIATEQRGPRLGKHRRTPPAGLGGLRRDHAPAHPRLFVLPPHPPRAGWSPSRSPPPPRALPAAEHPGAGRAGLSGGRGWLPVPPLRPLPPPPPSGHGRSPLPSAAGGSGAAPGLPGRIPGVRVGCAAGSARGTAEQVSGLRWGAPPASPLLSPFYPVLLLPPLPRGFPPPRPCPSGAQDCAAGARELQNISWLYSTLLFFFFPFFPLHLE